MNGMPHRWPASIWYGLAIGAAAVLFKWGHLVIPDEGVTLTEAWQISQGLVPYRDFFDFFTPGSLYVVAGAFRLFGSTYAVAKVVSLLLFLSSLYAWYRITLRLGLRGHWRAYPVVLWLLLSNHYVLINHNTYALVAAMWAMERLLYAYDRILPRGVAGSAQRAWVYWCGVAGGLAGVTVWMQQARGLAIGLAGALLLSVRKPRGVLPYLGGAALTLLPFLAWPLPTLYQALVAFPFFHYYPINQRGATQWLLWLLVSGYLAAAVVLVRNRAQFHARWFIWLAGLLLLASSFSRPDPAHLLPVSFPLATLLVIFCQEARGGGKLWRWPRWLLAGGFCALTLASMTITISRIQAVGFSVFLQLRDPQLERLVQLIHAEVPKDRPIFVAPFLPNLYFEAKRYNPTRLNMLIFGHHPDVLVRETAARLAADPPQLILLNYFFVIPQAFDQFLVGYPIADFVRQYYQYSGELNGIKIFRRRPGIPAP